MSQLEHFWMTEVGLMHGITLIALGVLAAATPLGDLSVRVRRAVPFLVLFSFGHGVLEVVVHVAAPDDGSPVALREVALVGAWLSILPWLEFGRRLVPDASRSRLTRATSVYSAVLIATTALAYFTPWETALAVSAGAFVAIPGTVLAVLGGYKLLDVARTEFADLRRELWVMVVAATIYWCGLVVEAGLMARGGLQLQGLHVTLDLVRVFAISTFLVCLGLMGRRVNHALQSEAERRGEALRHAGPEMADRLRSLFQHAPYCIHELDLDGRLTAMNPAGLGILGLEREAEVLGSTMLDAVAQPDRPRVEARFSDALRGLASEFEFSTLTGRRFASSFVPVRDERGVVCSVMGITVDVTASRALEDELRQERDFVANLFAAAPVVVVVLDHRGAIEHVNACFEEITGYTGDAVVGRDWFELMLPAADRAGAAQVFADLRAGAGGRRYVNPIVARDGRHIEMEWSNRILHGPGADREPRIMAIGLDLRPRRAAERSAAEKHAQLEGLVTAALDAVVVTDVHQSIVRFNPAAERMFGRPAAEVLGQPLATLIPGRFRADHAAHFEGFGADGVSVRPMGGNRPVWGLRADGIEFPIEASVSVFEVGEERFYAAFLRDVSERQRAEQELQRSTAEALRVGALLQAVVDSSPDWIFAKDRQHRYIFVNRAFASAQGQTPESMVGHRDEEFFPPHVVRGETAQGRGGFHETDDDALAGKPVRVVLEILPKDGRGPLQVETVKVALRDGTGEAYGVLSFSRDLTERVQMEARLRASETRLAEAQRMAKIGSWSLDLKSGALDWSEEIFRIFELDPATFQPSYAAFLEAIHPDDRRRVQEAYETAVAARRPYDVVHRLRFDDGRTKFVHEHCETEYDPAGAPSRSVGTVQDVTELRLAEVELRTVAERLQMVLVASPIVTYQLRIEGERFVPEWVSDNIERILGHTHAAAMDPDWWASVVHPEDAAETLAGFAAGVEAGQGGIDYRMLRPGLPALWVRDTFRVIDAEEGDGRRLVGVVADITERRVAEDALRQMNEDLERRVAERTERLAAVNQELETFSYTVSHDLKAPLRGIDGYGRLLEDAYGDRLDDDGRHCLRAMRQASSHMGRLIDDLLTYSRLERQARRPERLVLGVLVDALLSELAPEMRRRNVRLERRIPEDFEVIADRESLALAIRNLLDNAVKFTRDAPAPHIEVVIERVGASFHLRVRDNGIGFDPRFQGRIFEIFQRLNRAEDFEGTGIGLAIVRKAAERLGGRVWAESRLGEGACFHLEFPA